MRRGRKSASLEHVRGRVCVVSAYCVSGIEERSLHSRDDRRGGEEFGLIGSLGALCGNNVLRESLALYADNSVVALCGNGDDVEVDRRSDNTSVVVVGVISGDLTASADREKLNSVAVRSVDLGKSIDRRRNARTVCVGAVCADSALCGKLRIESPESTLFLSSETVIVQIPFRISLSISFILPRFFGNDNTFFRKNA